MAYRMVYLRIKCRDYDPRSSGDSDLTAFKEESRQLFEEMGWAIHEGRDGVSDTVTKDRQDLYLHPTSFSGVLDEATIPLLQERMANAKTFQCYAVDCYDEYLDLTDEEYRSELQSKRDEIAAFILEQCRTKRTDLYVVTPVADLAADHFEICRLCDKDRRNSVGRQFASELITQLLQEGRMVTAETDCGVGIRTTTAKELRGAYQPKEQVSGQITMFL